MRILADLLTVNLALAVALFARFVSLVTFGQRAGGDVSATAKQFVTAFLHNAPILSVFAVAMFAINGFYRFGSSYSSRKKPLVIGRAVAGTFLCFAAFTYLTWDWLGLVEVPRLALVLAAALSLAGCLAARALVFVFERHVQPERDLARQLAPGPGRKVLVIGGGGYIGSALLPKLLDAGCHVRILDCFLYGQQAIEEYLSHPKVEVVKGNFCNLQTVVEAMRGRDSVVHLGAIVGDPAGQLDEEVTKAVNLNATQMVANVAKAAGVRRFIFASTCSVYGVSNDFLTEESAVNPVSLYGRTKLAAEDGLKAMTEDTFRPTIVRFGTIYGFSGRTRFDLVVNLLSAMAKIEGRITVTGSDQWRPFVHVDDAANAVATLLRAPAKVACGQTFNVGSNEQNATLGDVGRLIREMAVGSELIISDGPDVDRRNYRVNFGKLAKAVGFKPQWTLADGVRQVLNAVAEGQVIDFRSPEYSNVKTLKEMGKLSTLREDSSWLSYLEARDRMVIESREPATATATSSNRGDGGGVERRSGAGTPIKEVEIADATSFHDSTVARELNLNRR